MLLSHFFPFEAYLYGLFVLRTMYTHTHARRHKIVINFQIVICDFLLCVVCAFSSRFTFSSQLHSVALYWICYDYNQYQSQHRRENFVLIRLICTSSIRSYWSINDHSHWLTSILSRSVFLRVSSRLQRWTGCQPYKMHFSFAYTKWIGYSNG